MGPPRNVLACPDSYLDRDYNPPPGREDTAQAGPLYLVSSAARLFELEERRQIFMYLANCHRRVRNPGHPLEDVLSTYT